jgi:hypothetical protein
MEVFTYQSVWCLDEFQLVYVLTIITVSESFFKT